MHNRRMDRCHNEKKVAIAGGGIAGMASALSLARAGWQAQVYERAAQFTEVGAGVQLGPNVTRILRAWGLERALFETASHPEGLRACSAQTGEVLARLNLHDVSARYGAPYVTVHRADLHGLLDQAARQAGVLVKLGTEVTSVQGTASGAQLAGTSAQAHDWEFACDAAVMADGVWSQLSAQVLPHLAPPRWSGHVAYRALLPMHDLPASLRWRDVTVWMGPHVHWVAYPVSAGERLNVVCLVESTTAQDAAMPDWSQRRSPAQVQADLQQALQSACSELRTLADACGDWRCWPLYGRRPMRGPDEHAQGCIALLGDAAHPMLPYLAQGAGMAMEDAWVLGNCLAAFADVATGIRAFAQQRWQRNARVQQQALRNGDIFHAEGLMRWARDQGLRWMGPALMDMPWLYGWRA
jgi:salicylate hydroxylase